MLARVMQPPQGTFGTILRMTTPDPRRIAPNCGNAVDDLSPDAVEASYSDWLSAMVQQDETALAAFYDATLSRVYGVALRITRKPEMAEEVVADVYLQVWRKASTYDAARGRILPWLLTICRSRALDILRRKDEAESHPEPETLRPDLQIGDNDPLDLLQNIERQTAIASALTELKPIQRQLIAMAFFSGFSHQEIAAQSGLPLGTVKTHIRRALEQLRQTLPAIFLGQNHE